MNEFTQYFVFGVLIGLVMSLFACIMLVDVMNYIDQKKKLTQIETEEKIKLLKLKGDTHGKEE